MKLDVEFQDRSLQMLRFLALIARTRPFDNARLNTYTLLRQALLADLFECTLNDMLPTWLLHETQRKQIVIHETDGCGKTDLGGRDMRLRGRLKHECTNGGMSHQKRVDLLN